MVAMNSASDTRLSHDFENQYPRHDCLERLGEVPLEVRLVDRDVLHRNDAAVRLLENPIDHQKRVPMRQEPTDCLDIEHSRSTYRYVASLALTSSVMSTTEAGFEYMWTFCLFRTRSNPFSSAISPAALTTFAVAALTRS